MSVTFDLENAQGVNAANADPDQITAYAARLRIAMTRSLLEN